MRDGILGVDEQLFSNYMNIIVCVILSNCEKIYVKEIPSSYRFNSEAIKIEAITSARNRNLLDAIREFYKNRSRSWWRLYHYVYFIRFRYFKEKSTIADLFKDNIYVSQVAEDDNKLASPVTSIFSINAVRPNGR